MNMSQYNYIIDNNKKKKFNIFSNNGISILKKYVETYKKYGGANLNNKEYKIVTHDQILIKNLLFLGYKPFRLPKFSLCYFVLMSPAKYLQVLCL